MNDIDGNQLPEGTQPVYNNNGDIIGYYDASGNAHRTAQRHGGNGNFLNDIAGFFNNTPGINQIGKGLGAIARNSPIGWYGSLPDETKALIANLYLTYTLGVAGGSFAQGGTTGVEGTAPVGSNLSDYIGTSAAAGLSGAAAGAGSGVGSGKFLSNYGPYLIGAGSNLIGGYLQNQAARDAEKERIKSILRTLSPAHINELFKAALPNVQAALNPINQNATGALRSRAAQAGLADSPFALTSEAGLRGQLANNAVQQAFSQALGLSQTQASSIGSIPTTPSNTGSLISGLGNSFLDYYARTHTPKPTPYTVPGNVNTGSSPSTASTPPFNQTYPQGGQFPYTPPPGVPKNPYLSYPGTGRWY